MADQDEQQQETQAEELPVVRVGETWESTDPAEDWRRRRLRVLEVPGDGGPVLVENVSSGRKSHIKRERFVPGSSGYYRIA